MPCPAQSLDGLCCPWAQALLCPLAGREGLLLERGCLAVQGPPVKGSATWTQPQQTSESPFTGLGPYHGVFR